MVVLSFSSKLDWGFYIVFIAKTVFKKIFISLNIYGYGYLLK